MINNPSDFQKSHQEVLSEILQIDMFIESKFQKRTQDRKTLEFWYTKDYRFNIQLVLSITLVEQDKNFFFNKDYFLWNTWHQKSQILRCDLHLALAVVKNVMCGNWDINFHMVVPLASVKFSNIWNKQDKLFLREDKNS